MTFLLKDTANPPPGDDGAPPPEAAAPVRPCPTCGAEMAPDQDWCLTCGQAAPGGLGARPGRRAFGTIAALTLVLAGGAVAASYAALQHDGRPPATSVASAPPAADVPPITTPPATTTPPAATTPALPPAGPKPKTPAFTPPPASSTPPVPSSPAPATPAATPSTPTTHTTPAKKPPPAPTGPQPIELGADAVTVYDPYTRATAQGDPVDAYDGDPSTAWKVTVPADGKPMAVGLVVDLGAKRSVDVADLTTRTPGFRAEVYATDSRDVPPDVLDTRWAHVGTATIGAKKGDTTKVSLDTGKSKYRYVLLWFTNPPKVGSTVRISELSLLG